MPLRWRMRAAREQATLKDEEVGTALCGGVNYSRTLCVVILDDDSVSQEG